MFRKHLIRLGVGAIAMGVLLMGMVVVGALVGEASAYKFGLFLSFCASSYLLGTAIKTDG